MKKLSGLIGLFLVNLVSAQDTQLGGNLGRGMMQIIDAVEGLFGPFFSVFLGGTGDLLFERVLFLFIIGAVVYAVLNSDRIKVFKDAGTPVIWIVTVTVSLLATRFLSDTALVKAVILPYSVIGVAITAIVPFIIYWAFVMSFEDSATMRKILWVFYIVVFLGLWGSRVDEIGSVSWIYFWSAMLALLFLLMDGTIRRWIVKNRVDRMDLEGEYDLLNKLMKTKIRIQNGHYPESEKERRIKKIEKEIEKVKKRIKKLS